MTFFTENPLRLSRVTLTSIVFPSRCHSCWTTVTLPTGLSEGLPACPGASVTKINTAAVSPSNLHIFYASWGEHRWKHMSEGFWFPSPVWAAQRAGATIAKPGSLDWRQGGMTERRENAASKPNRQFERSSPTSPHQPHALKDRQGKPPAQPYPPALL